MTREYDYDVNEWLVEQFTEEEEKDMQDFYIMDGRARFDTDRAIVVEVCESLREAKRAMREYYKGMDYVVVNGADVVYDPMHDRK